MIAELFEIAKSEAAKLIGNLKSDNFFLDSSIRFFWAAEECSHHMKIMLVEVTNSKPLPLKCVRNVEQKSGGDNELSKTICPTNRPLKYISSLVSWISL